MSTLPKEKITEFRSRIDQFQIQDIPVADIPAPIILPNLAMPPPPVEHVEEKMYKGYVRYGLKRRGEDVLSGGIIEFKLGIGKTSLAIFSIKSFMELGRELCVPKTEVFFHPVSRGVSNLILHVSPLFNIIFH